jgi:hypothetical protein
MRKIAILLLLLTFSLYSKSQKKFSTTYSLCNKHFNFLCIIGDNNTLSITMKVDGGNEETFELKRSDVQRFTQDISGKMLSKVSTCANSSLDALTFANELYANIAVSDVNETGKFKAADFKVAPMVALYQQDTSGTYVTTRSYKVKKMQVEIADGFIENMQVTVADTAFPDDEKMFTNLYSIGISSRSNIKDFKKVHLYSLESPPFVREDDTSNSILMSELVNYTPVLALGRRDYSPGDMVFEIKGGQTIELEKENTNKLFQANIYTDFIGLREDKPNGLIQTEASKKINTNTVQYLVKSPLIYRFIKSWGYLQYISPVVTLSKIEQQNKYLILADLDSVRSASSSSDTSRLNKSLHRYSSALKLLQYQSFSGGLDFNLFVISNHDLKYNVCLNVGGRVGITPVRDSLTKMESNKPVRTGFVNEYTINTLQFYPSLSVSWLPEERFSLTLSDKLVYLKPLNNKIQLLGWDHNEQDKFIVKKGAFINIIELQMALNVSDNGKMFARMRLNSEFNQAQGNFLQVQLGYAINILGKK